MYKVLVLYGHPADPEEFDRYYDQVHIPLAQQMRGLARWTVTRFEPGPDGSRPPYHCAAELSAPTRDELDQVLSSAAGLAANADVAMFASGGASFCFGEEIEIALLDDAAAVAHSEGDQR